MKKFSQKPDNPSFHFTITGRVGLDTGSVTPAEIALTIAAEIKALFFKGNGNSLKGKREQIHYDTINELVGPCQK